MSQHGLVALAALGICLTPLQAADATTPIDYTQRNTPYAPAETVAPERQKPATNPGVQEKRLDTTTVEKKTAPQGEQRARTEVKESKDKTLVEKNSRRPETIEQPTSDFNQRLSKVSTGSDTTKPPTVAKYQDRLTAATATNMARFPAIERATGAKINRFVFRKNPEETGAPPAGSTVTPAAGGAVLNK
jgi:hypothetical protein